MRNTKLTLLISGILLSTMQPAFAEGQPSLTEEQLRHEREMTELRKQKEILEIKHSQALLLRECHEMGIDCRGRNLEVTKKSPADELDAEIDSLTTQGAEQVGSDTEFSLNSISSSNSNPVLEAIQNDSARFKYAGDTQWALVGDKVGDWVVTHIDATKVRIKNSNNANTKTLVLNW